MFPVCLLYLLPAIYAVFGNPISESLQSKLENPAVVKFRYYIQIGNDLQKAVEFWKRQADEVGLKFAVYEPAGKPICVLTLPGANSSLPSIMLNSHMDVVPAVSEDWKYPPFAAEVDNDGNIFGRGTQDTKDVGIQYLEAIRKIKKENITLQRTMHLTLMPDEETGGFDGMVPFLKTPEFDVLNVGFALDEGMPAESDDFYATYQDRRPWQMNFTVEGNGGHGMTMPKDVAITKLRRLLDIMLEYRKSLAEVVKNKNPMDFGPYTTLNINMINGGTAPNTIPQRFNLIADMRLSPKENTTEILSLINSWVDYAGNNTKVEFLRQLMESKATPVDDSNPYWVAMKETINELGHKLIPIMCPATSDMAYVRNRGIPALGFAPAPRTKPLAHAANEYLNVDVFLQGIDVYVALIKKFGNLPEY